MYASENDPRNEDDLNIDPFIAEINKSAGDLREAMETVLENLSDEEILLAGNSREDFCEVAMIRLRAEILERATDLAQWEKNRGTT